AKPAVLHRTYPFLTLLYNILFQKDMILRKFTPPPPKFPHYGEYQLRFLSIFAQKKDAQPE
ncbi:MAG: hypothetical protein KBH49_02945, partial [Faecalibacterium sp.]|nr:hypothetical protein [Faecalibacterium sp.]